MQRIASFEIDHTKHPKGMHLSRQDGTIFTYDLRIRLPYREKRLTNTEMHSLEHLLATILRNQLNDSVVYVGPMGCQTGFYVLLKDLEPARALPLIKNAFRSVADYTGKMPGKSRKECGYHYNLDTGAAKQVAAEFLQVLENIQ